MDLGQKQMNNNDRYKRNIAIKEIGIEGQEKLKNSKILICGAGGLGSTVISNLASIGIGNIGIIDYDLIEISNLNRQYIHKFKSIGEKKVISAKNWIYDFNNQIKVDTYDIKLNLDNYSEIVKKYDLIIDCFDSYHSKFILNTIAIKSKKILIHAGVSEFYGQVTSIIPHHTPCLNCIIPFTLTDEKEIPKGVISPIVSTIASIQSLEAVKLILNIGDPLINHLLIFNGLNMSFKKIFLKKNPKCKVCN